MTATPSLREELAVGSFLGAAVGDALGWPYEGRARRYQPSAHPSARHKQEEFFNWTRSGSRYQPYREPISPGAYSDDTQLLLSTARSILYGRDWWEHFAFVELPFWRTYERGGGGATKRAAQSWLTGKAPWKSIQSRGKYFDAGGNGVAMRILPHLIVDTRNDSDDVRRQVILNGLCTHGHPRALVGALLHAMTLWLSLRQEGMLEFGALTQAVHKGFSKWAQLPELPAEWLGVLSDREVRDYQTRWEKTIDECMALIEIVGDGLRMGPLSAGPETLYKLGALDRKTNGSGTITAASALFLASRYAATPFQGMMVAATTSGADTDTLASMCGSVFGAIHGYEWLGHFANSVQDSRYIRKLAVGLTHKSVNFNNHPFSRITKRDCDAFAKRLRSLEVGVEVRLPDGRQAIMRRVEPMLSESAQADLCNFETEDGQTFAVKRIIRRPKSPPVAMTLPAEEILRIGIKVFVSDLAEAKDFYVRKLCLPIAKEYPTGFTVAEVISVYLANGSDEQPGLTFQPRSLPPPMPCFRITNIDVFGSRLAAMGIAVTQISEQRSTKTVRLCDPFGNELEFFEGR